MKETANQMERRQKWCKFDIHHFLNLIPVFVWSAADFTLRHLMAPPWLCLAASVCVCVCVCVCEYGH